MAEHSDSSRELLRVELTENDIPGAVLSTPFKDPTVPALKWWLLCRGIKLSWLRDVVLCLIATFAYLCFKHNLHRMHQAISEATPVTDVDGSYLYLKHQRLTEEGVNVAQLDLPLPPLTGWETVNESNVRSLAVRSLACVCSNQLKVDILN